MEAENDTEHVNEAVIESVTEPVTEPAPEPTEYARKCNCRKYSLLIILN